MTALLVNALFFSLIILFISGIIVGLLSIYNKKQVVEEFKKLSAHFGADLKSSNVVFSHSMTLNDKTNNPTIRISHPVLENSSRIILSIVINSHFDFKLEIINNSSIFKYTTIDMILGFDITVAEKEYKLRTDDKEKATIQMKNENWTNLADYFFQHGFDRIITNNKCIQIMKNNFKDYRDLNNDIIESHLEKINAFIEANKKSTH
jgi:hypothetical protein